MTTTKSAYSEKLQDPKWQRKRLEVMKRDGFACVDCGSKIKTLHVHHCFYAKGDPWDTPDACLVTVCWDCHDQREREEKSLRQHLGELLALMTTATSREALCGALASMVAGKRAGKVVTIDLTTSP